MDTNKILTADLLDLVFDDRNKEYGAYDLRRTYQRRITKAMIITGSMTVLIFGGSLLAQSFSPKEDEQLIITQLNLSRLPDDPEPAVIPPPEKQPETKPVQEEQWETPVLADVVDEPPPNQDQLDIAKIGTEHFDGDQDAQIQEPAPPGDSKGVVEDRPESKEPAIYEIVQVEAKFSGNWENFLRKNLNAEVPVNNDAPTGRYTVQVQFVVDVDGSVSDIKPISNVGYGMEQEAVRVLKKAAKWEPAFQNGKYVKAYRRQVIIFEVVGEE